MNRRAPLRGRTSPPTGEEVAGEEMAGDEVAGEEVAGDEVAGELETAPAGPGQRSKPHRTPPDGTNPPAPASADPFDDMPPGGTIIVRLLLGLAVMICTMSVFGYTLTKLGAFEPLREWDHSVNVKLADDRSNWAAWWAQRVTEMGDTAPVLGVMALVTIVLAIQRRWRAMTFLPMAMLAEIATFLSVSYLVQRPRPDVERLGPLPGTHSFPSGHVAATFVCWICCAILLSAYGHLVAGRVFAVIGATLSVAMGWARVYVGMHHPIDVAFGLAMGIASVVIAVQVLSPRFGTGRGEHPP